LELIDVHVHCGWYENEYYDPEETYKLLTKSGVTAFALASTTAQLVSQDTGNSEVLRLRRTHPDRIIALIWISPYLPNWRSEAVHRVDQGFSGIKLDPFLGHYRVEHHFLAPVFQFAEEYELPIFAHAYPTSEGREPEAFRPLAMSFPSVPLIISSRPSEGLFRLVREFDQLKLDSVHFEAKDFERVLSHVGTDRLLWGSGYPTGAARALTGSPLDYQQKLRRLQQVLTSRTEFQLVTSENAARLFRTTTLIR
jgi:hypothetical protein